MGSLLFKKVDYPIRKLLEDIALGEIALPDIQRPFVWSTTQVRDLFDSLYRGYPIGTLLFWETGFPGEYRSIGENKKQKTPRLLIVDGQQRLTALYAVIKGEPIITQDFHSHRLCLAFNPIEEKFEVTNTFIERDPCWISDISQLWAEQYLYSFITTFLERLSQCQNLSDAERMRVPEAIQRVVRILEYPIVALEISAQATEEQVADIFVRINSKGRRLNQADFILTLMSVFWDEGRKELEKFCRDARYPPTNRERPSSYNPYFQPTPDQLLRVDVALAFRRARLEHVYSLLRGKDLQTGQFSSEQRDRQFDLLRKAQTYVIDYQHWHDFLQVIKCAGYLHPNMITSKTTLIYTYALWLIGKRDFGVPLPWLRNLMARWFFMASLTGRYSGSPETRMEQDLALLRGQIQLTEFVGALEQEMNSVLTPDYWQTTLPNELAVASAQSPVQAAYFAALCILDAPVLFSTMKVRQLLDPTSQGWKRPLERHHLFPRAYLERLRFERRDINQVANYALIEWHQNIAIGDKHPREYAPELEKRFAQPTLKQMYYYHALPDSWYDMDYVSFLKERRRRIAQVIQAGFNKLVEDFESLRRHPEL